MLSFPQQINILDQGIRGSGYMEEPCAHTAGGGMTVIAQGSQVPTQLVVG